MSLSSEQLSVDARWMRQAVAAAKKAWGRTSPNPLVGAVVVKGNESWKGWHKEAGEAHAEVNALQAAGSNACGASLYVTLEPCSTHGRTPPCTEAILAAGVRRVVIGSLDPNPSHAGRAVEMLKDCGLEVVAQVEDQRCQEMNEAFNCWIRYRRPYVQLKMAMTLDGRIATESGQSQWITGPTSRRRVQKLRQWCDAIVVGGETVRQDDPQLLVRQPEGWPKQPLRLIASPSGNIPDGSQVLTDGLAETRILSCKSKSDWQKTMFELGDDGITALLVEGGGELAGQLLQYGLIDKVSFFVAPKILTGRASRPVVGGDLAPMSLAEAKTLTGFKTTRSGEDILITGYLSDVHRYC